jgi:hypothetical protein
MERLKMLFPGIIKRNLVFFLAFMFAVVSCDTPTSSIEGEGGNNNNTGTKKVTLAGVVENAVSGVKIDYASVKVLYDSSKVETQTDGSGAFSVEFTIDSTQMIAIVIGKAGFIADTSLLSVIPGATYTIQAIKLTPVTTPSTSSGPASSIYLLSQSTTSIGVQASGSIETGKLTFQVVDSLGVPITYSNRVNVKFSVGARPNGGEFIFPDVSATDSSGQVSVFLTSGLRAGVVQIFATINIDNKVIYSQPVSYTIHGGLPDDAHFSIAPEYVNIPGFNISGVIDNISAYVGDKYGNPVRPNTSVYFTTDGGIIEGSAQTDELGIGTVRLVSADPRPVHQLLGPGVATVTGKTADENGITITDDILVLFSGYPVLTITPTTFDVPNNGTQTFFYEVMDQHGNPLSSGTSISVTVNGKDLETGGDESVQLPDTQSKAWTQFSFTITDTDTVPKSRAVNIKVTADGPNGKGTVSASGVVR